MHVCCRLVLLSLLAAVPSVAWTHGPVARQGEAQPTAARLFIADSANGQVVVMDLPQGEILTRLATPPHILSLGLDASGRYVFAIRGRNTDRDTITVIDSGFDGAGKARFPVVARTFTGDSPGGVREGRISVVGGRNAIFHEGAGEIEVLGTGDLASLGAVGSRRIGLVAPDHYHYLEVGRFLYVGHLAKALVQIIDRETGEEVGRIGDCPALHGMADDAASGRLFFACAREVLVIGTRGAEQNREVARIPYPGEQRVGFFLEAADGILWGKTEGAIPTLQRLDTRSQPYVFTAIEVDASIQQRTTADGRYLLVYSRSGMLDIRDGVSGALQHQLRVSKAFDAQYHEHVDKALLPDIVSSGKRAWISIPPEGVIVEVDVPAGKELRRLATGGQPTRLVLVE